MPRANTRATYIDVTLHQAARRDALASGLVPPKDLPEPMSLNEFLTGLFVILSIFIMVLWAIRP